VLAGVVVLAGAVAPAAGAAVVAAAPVAGAPAVALAGVAGAS
jgi:hypothetical protein